jgi:hypothetical protein
MPKYLKIVTPEKVKKVKLGSAEKDIADFFGLLVESTKFSSSNMHAFFQDVENEVVPLKDRLDLDYFIDIQEQN